MSDDVWHVPSDDDPTEIVEIHPVTITLPTGMSPMGRVKVGKATVSWGPRTYGPDTVIANAPVEAIDDLAAAVLQAQIQLRGQS